MEYGWGFIIVLVLFHAIRYFMFDYQAEKEAKEADSQIQTNIDREVKDLFINREERNNFNEFDEKDFWILVDKTRKRSKENYKNFNSIFKDELSKKTSEEIILIDNLILRFFKESYSFDLLSATFIILKKSDLDSLNLLLSIFISRGEVFFKNTTINVNLCKGKSISDFGDDRSLLHITSEAYFNKTNTLIPYLNDEEINISGEPTEEKDIPVKFSELWSEYFY